MSLKSFHMFFIVASVLTAAGFAVWAGVEFGAAGGGGLLLMAVISGGLSIALSIYAVAFRRKAAHLPEDGLGTKIRRSI